MRNFWSKMKNVDTFIDPHWLLLIYITWVKQLVFSIDHLEISIKIK